MLTLKIAVAIPTHKPHLKFLERCLDSIEKQTRKPDIVSISASSCQEKDLELEITKYTFPIKIHFSELSQNAAQNRNIAANLLKDTEYQPDIISFFDCDDEMIPTRLEFIERAFQETKSALIVHNYVWMRTPDSSSTPNYTDYVVFQNAVIPNPTHCGVYTQTPYNAPLHHGHVSTLYHIWETYPFNETQQCLWMEDSVFCKTIASRFKECSYIQTQLCIYHDYKKD